MLGQMPGAVYRTVEAASCHAKLDQALRGAGLGSGYPPVRASTVRAQEP